MCRVLKPPVPIQLHKGERSVFLAGSIEMGRAEPWQDQFELAMAERPIAILNPRRDAWDETWEQSIQNPQFRGQVEWELEGLEKADVVAMYFDPATKSPITMLELGLLARTDRVVVCTPEGFWRRGNIEVVCARYGIPLVNRMSQLIDAVQDRLTNGST